MSGIQIDRKLSGEMIELFDLPKDHMSHSAEWVFLSCPKKYEYKYVLGLKERPSAPMLLGIAGHETLNWRMDQQIMSQAPSLSQIHAFFVERLPVDANELQQRSDHELDWGKKDSIQKLTDDGVRMLAVFEDVLAPAFRPVEVERAWEMELEGLSWKVQGRSDIKHLSPAGEPRAILSDYKFRGRRPSKSAAKISTQLTLYQTADDAEGNIVRLETAVAPGTEPTRLPIEALQEITLVRKAKSAEVHVSFSLPRTEDQKAERLQNMATVVQSIRTGYFPKCNDPQVCGRCSFLELCHPDWAAAFKEDGEEGDES
jgi:hypothetical protein